MDEYTRGYKLGMRKALDVLNEMVYCDKEIQRIVNKAMQYGIPNDIGAEIFQKRGIHTYCGEQDAIEQLANEFYEKEYNDNPMDFIRWLEREAGSYASYGTLKRITKDNAPPLLRRIK